MKRTCMMLGALLLGGGYAMAAQDYPSRPINAVVAFPAGGSADIVTRLVTDRIASTSNYRFVVENRTGAGGNIAFAAVAEAKPDGYTVLFSTPGIAINPSLYRKVNFRAEQFRPIALIGEAPLVLMVNPKLPIKSVSELIEASQRAPDAIRFASSGNGSSSHLAADLLRSQSALQYLHVPYRGGTPAMTDVIGGQADITMLPISESLPYIKEGRLRALGQTGAQRSPIAPDIPTIAEGGVKGYATTTWYMVLGPRDMPDAAVEDLRAQISRVLSMPDLRQRLQQAGVSVIDGDPRQAGEFLAKETARWAAAIKASGTRLD